MPSTHTRPMGGSAPHRIHPHPIMTTTVVAPLQIRLESWLAPWPLPCLVTGGMQPALSSSLDVDMSSPSKRIAPEAQRSAGPRYHVAISRVRTNVELMKLCSTYSVRDLRARPSGDLETRAPRRRTSGASIVDPHLFLPQHAGAGKERSAPGSCGPCSGRLVPMTVTAKRVLVTRLGAHAEGGCVSRSMGGAGTQGPGSHDGPRSLRTYGGRCIYAVRPLAVSWLWSAASCSAL